MKKKTGTRSITIAIPAYNEEENIRQVIRNVFKTLPRYFRNFEVVIINDGSTDATGKIADQIAKRRKELRVIHQANAGYSQAMLAGIKAARKEYVAYMPADGQFLIEDMRHCFEALKDQPDLVLGYRGGRPDYNTKRMIFSYGYLTLLTLLFNIKYMDVGWVHIWKTKKIQKIKFTCSRGIFILAEIVIRFMRKGYKVVEAPSYYHPRQAGEAKNARLKVVVQTFLSTLKLWLELLISR